MKGCNISACFFRKPLFTCLGSHSTSLYPSCCGPHSVAIVIAVEMEGEGNFSTIHRAVVWFVGWLVAFNPID